MPGPNKTIIEDLPFSGKTIYKDSFKGTQPYKDEELEFVRQWAKRNNYKLPNFPIL